MLLKAYKLLLKHLPLPLMSLLKKLTHCNLDVMDAAKALLESDTISPM